MSEKDFREYLRVLIVKTGSNRAFASKLGISAQYLGDILSGKRTAGPKILKPLGFTRKVVIEKRVTYDRKCKV